MGTENNNIRFIDEDSLSSDNTTMELFNRFQELYTNQFKGTDETCDGLKVSCVTLLFRCNLGGME